MKTFDDFTNLEKADDLTIFDTIPLQVSVAFIGLIDYYPCDDEGFKIEIEGSTTMSAAILPFTASRAASQRGDTRLQYYIRLP